MTKEEYIVMDKQELIDRVNGAIRELESIADDLNDADSVVDYIPDNNLEQWKENVLNSLPEDSSLKMREDVEAFLDTIKGIY